MDSQQVARFAALFAGNIRVYGTYKDIGTVERGDGKLLGTPRTAFGVVTQAMYERHLEGGNNGLGIVPIRDDDSCSFGAIDIDQYDDLDHSAIARQLKDLGLPLIPCRSKSGGCHIYLFTKSPVAAKLMQGKLKEIASAIAHGTSEIFPKQTHIDEESKKRGGAWINLPFSPAEGGARYAFNETGDALSFAEFLDYAEGKRVAAEFFGQRVSAGPGKQGKAAEKDPLPDGPPCLNRLIEISFPLGTQDTGMFNLGIYARKAHPSNWAQWLQGANERHFSPQIAPDDMRRIIASLGKTEYKYGCQNEPLKGYCNSQLCRKRKFGVGDSSEVVIFGDVRKLETVPPIWYWDVTINDEDPKTLELSTAEMQDPMAVQRKCIEQLNAAPPMPKRNDWTQTLQGALKRCTVLDALPEDSSVEGQFWNILENYCTGLIQAFTMDEILMGKPHSAKGKTYFRMADLMAFLKRQGFIEYKVNQVAKVLRGQEKARGVKHISVNLKGKFVNLWVVDEFPSQTSGHDVPASITNETSQF